MTLVSPLQLLLFGSKKVVSDGEIILLDDWYEPLAVWVLNAWGGANFWGTVAIFK